jgi:hypothetical protein
MALLEVDKSATPILNRKNVTAPTAYPGQPLTCASHSVLHESQVTGAQNKVQIQYTNAFTSDRYPFAKLLTMNRKCQPSFPT